MLRQFDKRLIHVEPLPRAGLQVDHAMSLRKLAALCLRNLPLAVQVRLVCNQRNLDILVPVCHDVFQPRLHMRKRVAPGDIVD